MIYMDNAATTKLRPEVIRAMLPFMSSQYGNPSGAYMFAENIKTKIEQSRTILAQSIHAKDTEIYFTSGGTESDNWAIKMMAAERKNGHIVTTAMEHHAVLRSCEQLEKQGISITYIKPDKNGIIDVQKVENAIRKDTFLVSVMAANNEIGTIQPLEQLGQLTEKRKICFHTDAVQAYTNMDIDVEKMHIDMLSTSAHKLNGPKGIGFLYIRENVLHSSFIHGGGQEHGMRAGTENTAGVAGFAQAVKMAVKIQNKKIAYEERMRDYMIKRVLYEIPMSQLNGDAKCRLPGNMNFTFPFVDGGTLIAMLDEQGILASAGSACSTHEQGPSHVLKSMGMSDEQAYSSVRFTINEEIDRNQIDYVMNCLKKDIYELRMQSKEYLDFIKNKKS